ncbi:hypothetical protein GCM10023260_12890 [Bartonella acomydis]|uniref:ABC transmembrane type-1 domain-containing protein n=2 Tax=Bartonella acomydis TaxID=686234 RepID=A0ABP9MWD2_9HYPH
MLSEMNNKRGNLPVEQETYKRARSFTFEDALLSTKNYKVIFILSVIIALCQNIPFIIILLKGEFAAGMHSLVGVLFFLLYMIAEVILMGLLLLLPVFFVFRIIITRRLKKKIQNLEEAIFVGENISRLQNALAQECEGENG